MWSRPVQLKDFVINSARKAENCNPLLAFIIQFVKVPTALSRPCSAFCYGYRHDFLKLAEERMLLDEREQDNETVNGNAISRGQNNESIYSQETHHQSDTYSHWW